MSRFSRQACCFLINFTLYTLVISQSQGLHGTDNVEDVKIQGHHKQEEKLEPLQEDTKDTVRTNVKKNDLKGYATLESNLVGHASQSLGDRVPPVEDAIPELNLTQKQDAGEKEEEAVKPLIGKIGNVYVKVKQVEHGIVSRFIDWLMGIIQTDFNFLISCGTVMSSFLTQVIPIHTVMTIRCNKSTGNLKTLNFVTVAFSNFLWSLYGILSENMVIMLSSVPGFLLSCCYIVVFHRHCQDQHEMSILRAFYKLSLLSCIILILTYLGIEREPYLKFIGLFGGSIQGFSYLTPLFSIKEVVRNRSTSAMPTEISLGNLLGAFFTLCYGFIIWDYIVIAPNFIGMASGMIQVIILVLITNNDKIIVKEVDILERQQLKPSLKSEFEI